MESIDDDDELYRRLIKGQIKDDGSVSSAAFSNTKDTNGMSVNLARLSSIKETSFFKDIIYGVASFHAGNARQHKQIVFHDPDYEYDNYAHTTVWGNKPGSTRKRLARGATVRLDPFKTVKN